MPMPPELLVGIETADDAAVYQLNDEQALIATTDFFMPIVDDPFDFGRIAATNAISDVYAMGGKPILALALVGMPINVLSTQTIGRILEGGASVCRAAGIPIAGGHTIDSVEPSTAWWRWAWCTPSASSATPTRAPATCWCWASRWAWA
jgi:selenide,water dikinase